MVSTRRSPHLAHDELEESPNLRMITSVPAVDKLVGNVAISGLTRTATSKLNSREPRARCNSRSAIVRENLSRAARRQEWSTEYFSPYLQTRIAGESVWCPRAAACASWSVIVPNTTDLPRRFDAARIHDPARPAAEAGHAPSGRAVRG